MMRRTIVTVLALLPGLVFSAVPDPEGRWQGQIQIPGKTLLVVVDLAPDGGAWTGSIIIPGLDIKGARLAKIDATPNDIAFDIASILDTPSFGPAHFEGRLRGDAIDGTMRQGGNVAKFSLARSGPAQVDIPIRNTAVRRNLEDQWTGEFELGGYPRQVTLTLENHADKPASATLVIVGKRTTDVPIDRVTEDGEFITIESTANQVLFEGRLAGQSDEIRGTIGVGPFELPLVLRRSPRSPS
jgi:hypothetical protein